MREQDLAGAQPAAYRVTTRQDPDAKAAPDLICRDFTSQEPGSRLCGDITYIRTWAGWAYLAVVIDLSTKMIVGWQISNRASAPLCVEALKMAHRNGHVQADAIFHSDRGCQYTSGRSTAPPAALTSASRWDEPASAGTTPRPKRSSPRSKSNASTAPRSRASTTPAARSAATSKCSTTVAAGTRPSTTRPPTSDTHSSPTSRRKPPEDDRPKFRTQPKPATKSSVAANATILVTMSISRLLLGHVTPHLYHTRAKSNRHAGKPERCSWALEQVHKLGRGGQAPAARGRSSPSRGRCAGVQAPELRDCRGLRMLADVRLLGRPSVREGTLRRSLAWPPERE